MFNHSEVISLTDKHALKKNNQMPLKTSISLRCATPVGNHLQRQADGKLPLFTQITRIKIVR